jgi:large subunit ribosomal protein L15
MVARKRAKSTRQRAGTTHGFGAMKKNRGAGNRGGRGNAGSGKRGDAKKPCFWDKNKYGMQGFTSKSRTKEDIIMNISDLMAYAQKTGKKEIDLSEIKVTKLLGSGKATQQITVKVKKASPKAILKIEEAKGKITTESNVEEN